MRQPQDGMGWGSWPAATAMTGYEGGLRAEDVAAAGVTAVLPKPAGLGDLARLLRRHLTV